jgi:hypothetical protein
MFIIFVENASMRKWTSTLQKDISYILITSGMIFSYWIFVATPVYKNFMSRGLKIGSFSLSSDYTIILFYSLFFIMFGIIYVKRKFNIFLIRERPTSKSIIVKFLLTMITILISMSIFSIIKLPWTNFNFTLLSILYSIPLVLIFSFGVAGFRYTRFIKNGYFIRGWLFAILVSFGFGLVTNSSTILPHRHFEYIMAPLSIISIYGISGIFLKVNYKAVSKFAKKLSSVKKTPIINSKKPNILQNLHLILLHKMH